MNLAHTTSASHSASDPTDALLMGRVARQDRAAFEMLYDRHAGMALGLAIRILGERAAAEEVLQDVFWRIWQRASTFDFAQGSFGAWLLGIVRNRCIDELRKRRGRQTALTVEIDAQADYAQDLRDTQTDVSEAVWHNLRSEQVRTTLAALPDSQRIVLEMAYFENLTRQEIAERLGEPLGTVHTRARLGLIKLKDLLASLQGLES